MPAHRPILQGCERRQNAGRPLLWFLLFVWLGRFLAGGFSGFDVRLCAFLRWLHVVGFQATDSLFHFLYALDGAREHFAVRVEFIPSDDVEAGENGLRDGAAVLLKVGGRRFFQQFRQPLAQV